MPDSNEDEYEGYLRYIYDRDIAAAVERYWASLTPFEWSEEFAYPLNGLARADSLLRLAGSLPDIYDTFRPAALTQVLRYTSNGAQYTSQMADQLGFSQALDSDFVTIARGMTPRYLPPEEAELLRRHGFADLAASLPAMVYAARVRADSTAAQQYRQVPPSRTMSDVGESLNSAISDHERLEELDEELAALRRGQNQSQQEIEQLEQELESRKKPRRWWGAVRKIIQGTATTLADIAVAVGVGTTIAPPAWLTIVSVVAGVSTLTEALDEVRHEN
jgi:O6-methylguanine-DNA--protein-cysteine methyltransferase